MAIAKKQALNNSFILVITYLIFDVFFSAFSPKWTDQLGAILIEDETLIIEPEKLKHIKPLPTVRFINVGDIEIKTSVKIDARQLKNLCDRSNNTKVNFNIKTKRGDNVVLNYGKSFHCKGISLRLNGGEDLRLILETSADGLVYNTVKIIKPGANDVELQNEKIKSVRVVAVKDSDKPWTLGDINCR